MANSYEGQIMVYEQGMAVWKSIRCSGRDGYTYRFKTEKGARSMLESCYPGVEEEKKRILPSDEEPNIQIQGWED